MGLPFAGHKDNHAGLMTKEQMETVPPDMGIRPGHEWDLFEGLAATEAELRAFPRRHAVRDPADRGRACADRAGHSGSRGAAAAETGRPEMSTQGGFGDILAESGAAKVS